MASPVPSADEQQPQPAIAPPVSAGELATGRTGPAPVGLVIPSWRTLARWLLVALALYAVGWLLWSALPALTPFVIGLVLAYLLLPIVNALSRRLPRPAAILLVYLVGIGALAGLIAFVAPLLADQVEQLIGRIPSVERLQQLGSELLQRYRSSVPASIQAPIEDGLRSALRTAQSNATTYLQSVGTVILTQVCRVHNTQQ